MSLFRQARSRFWQQVRQIQSVFNVATPPHISFSFIANSHSVIRNGGSGRLFADALNYILLVLPGRWPLPVPFFAAGLVIALTVAINGWVAFDVANDLFVNNELFPTDPKCQGNTFDYIVVGAGTAGIIVATRVANASRNLRVLLLDIGGEPSIFNDLPALDFLLMNHPANTWTYKTIPQKHISQNCEEHKTVTTRGKMLGGSSAINFMFYARGHREDFNRWALDAQDDQWNYSNLLPFFKKSEDYNGAYANDPSSHIYHGRDGLLNIATHSYMPGVEEFLAAGAEKGYHIGDYNGAEQEVFSKMDVTTQDGWRESVYRAYYQDTGKPSNLCIKKYAHVTKINFETVGKENKVRAVGVTYQRHDLTRTVIASKEVILSAGVFGSGKLLLLSGIGPIKDMRALGINPVMDLPVGKNLQDHPYVLVGPFLKGPALNPGRDGTVKSAAEFIGKGDGLIAAPAGFAGTAFLQSPVAVPAYPDLQVIQFSIALYPDISRLLNNILGIKESIVREWLHPYNKQYREARLLSLYIGRPKSVGQISLASADPNDDLIIDPNYLSHPDDREALLYGFKTMVNLFENTTSLNTPLFPNPVPGCEKEHFKSDNYFRCVVKHMSGSFYHHVGTCALGKVVDSRLRVKGVEGLRVIDASVIPRSPNANTQASTILVGEKGADLVIKDMNKRFYIDNEG